MGSYNVPFLCVMDGVPCTCNKPLRRMCEDFREKEIRYASERDRRGNPQRFTLYGGRRYNHEDGDYSITVPYIDPDLDMNEEIKVREDRVTEEDILKVSAWLAMGFSKQREEAIVAKYGDMARELLNLVLTDG